MRVANVCSLLLVKRCVCAGWCLLTEDVMAVAGAMGQRRNGAVAGSLQPLADYGDYGRGSDGGAVPNL